MNARYYLLGCLALAACDMQEPQVVVNFDQPFPVGAPDLPGFLPRHRKPYTLLGDSGRRAILSAKALVEPNFYTDDFTGEWLDSMRLARQPGTSRGRDGVRYTVLGPTGTGGFRVRAEAYDTLLSLLGSPLYKLRHYRGCYYLNSPAAEDSTKWTVQRLLLSHGQIAQQLFNPDSLRILALDPAIVQRHHCQSKLIITLAPQSRPAIKQVSSYDGLWLNEAEYLSSVLKTHRVEAIP